MHTYLQNAILNSSENYKKMLYYIYTIYVIRWLSLMNILTKKQHINFEFVYIKHNSHLIAKQNSSVLNYKYKAKRLLNC